MPPFPWQLPATSTFIMEDDKGFPMLCVTLYMIENTPICWVENLVSRPGLDAMIRRKGVYALLKHLEETGKARGKSVMLAMGLVGKKGLLERYTELGFRKTAQVYTYGKELA